MEIVEKKSKVKGDSTESYHRYETMVERLLTIVGLWPSENSVWSYYGRPYIVLVILMLALAPMINYIVRDLTTTQETIEVASFSTTASSSMLKVFMITINRKKVRVLYQRLQNYVRETEQEGRLMEYAYERVEVCYSLAHTLTITVFGAFVTVVVIPCLYALICLIWDPAAVEFQLIYPARYPWDPSSNRLAFVGIYIIQLMTTLSTSISVSGIDGFLLLLVCQGVIILRAMAYRLNNIENSENHEDVLDKCVQNWVFIIHLRDELQRIYGPIILYNVVTSVFLMCTLMFQLAQIHLTMQQALLMIAYMSAKGLQIFITTWSGTLLQEESERYLNNVYLSDWLSARSSRSTYITLFQRPLVVKACHILDVSVEIFAKTINTTISYYLMLRTIA